ncbi:hypothetical protein MUK42_11553 [Musa troglodytarum]|uniref:Uncharacterized protein n=1 Tax=Musa troglodytarum TaxID=320322 RepID=A0A9E7GXW3_9LILI|nr:hypothetical protein MUK42_11553 [Musa troglodytarum]
MDYGRKDRSVQCPSPTARRDPIPPSSHIEPSVVTSRRARGKANPEMILEAMAALNDKNGKWRPSTATCSLGRHEGQRQPAVHQERLLQARSNAQRKRGHGRQLKFKPVLRPGTVLPPSRPRGRPPKPKFAVAKFAAGISRPLSPLILLLLMPELVNDAV